MRRVIIIFLICSFFAFSPNDKIKVELISQFYLDQKKEPVAKAWDIAVDEKENIYVVDGVSSNVKIYSKDGKIIKIFGEKGGGPGEFMHPFRIDIDSKWICVQDVGASKYMIFDREFKEVGRFFYLLSPNDSFVMNEEKVITNGYFVNRKGKEFRGVILDFSGKAVKVLMPIPYPRDDGWNRITDAMAFVDVSKNGDIYFVKEREVKLFKFSKSGEFVKKFGRNPSYFLQCKKTKDFDLIYRGGSQSEMMEADERWRRSFSWVSGIFVLKDFLGILITKYNGKLNKWEYFLQFYDFNGNLLEDGQKLKEIGTSDFQHFFMMDSNHKDMLYILEPIEEEPKYRFTKYRIRRVSN